MNFIQLKGEIEITIRKSWGLLFSLALVSILELTRVSSHKYSFDTTVIFLIFRSLIFDRSTLISMMGLGSVNFFNIHFSPIYILLSPLYFLGPTLLILFWKVLCYGGFLVILWRIIDSDIRYNVSNWHKNLFFILVALHPTFITNLISPDIWDSDLILPFLGLSILCISKNRYHLGVFLFCVTFLIKEDMMLIGVLYGILLVLITKNVKYLFLSLFSLCWFWVVTHVVMPSFAASTNELGLLKFSFGNLGNSMGEIVVNSIINPQLLIDNGWWIRKFVSLLIIFLCMGFLPFMRKQSLIYMLPSLSVLGYTIIAAQPYLDYSKHYMLAFFVFVVWSSYESYILVSEKLRSGIVLTSVIAGVALILFVQMGVRVWSYYIIPVANYSTLASVKEEFIPQESHVLTGGISSPWVCYKIECFVSGSFQPEEIEKNKYEFILINLSTVFWETINCSDESLVANLKALGNNMRYGVLVNSDDVVLLKRGHFNVDSKQQNWTGDLERYRQTNHDCMKSDLMKNLRLL